MNHNLARLLPAKTCLLFAALSAFTAAECPAQTGADDRAFAVQTLTHIASPVLSALAEGKLKAALPTHDWERTGPITRRSKPLAARSPASRRGSNSARTTAPRENCARISLTSPSSRSPTPPTRSRRIF